MSIFGSWFGFGRDDIFNEAIAAYERGDFDGAIEGLEQCVDDRIDPATARLAKFRLADCHIELARILLREGRNSEALSHVEIALVRFANYPEVSLLAAKAAFSMGDRERTRRYLDRSLKANPHLGESVAFDGAVLFAEGHKAEGLSRAAEAFEVDPTWNDVTFASAVEAAENGLDARALSLLLSAGHESVADPKVFINLGDSLVRDHRNDAAAEVYRKALSIAPDHADAHFRLGRALFDDGEVEEAAREFEIAVNLDPEYRDAMQFIQSVSHGQTRRRIADA